jgi:periplasmic copper chaperone A
MLTRAGALVLALLVSAVAACGGSSAAPSAAPSAGDGTITITDPWVRAAASGGVSAAYFTIANGQAVDDALTGAASAVASSVGVHETSADASGMMGMHEVESIAIPAGGSVALKPGGYHVMLMGLKQDLKAGDTVELQLTFKGSPEPVRVVAEVREN